MTARPGGEPSPECSLGEHPLCPGPIAVLLASAPEWGPVVTMPCSCSCHPQPPAATLERATAGARRPYTP
jgi:hypothetical protein